MPDANGYPPGEYAIVELFGHATLVGRVEEVERFGTKMLAIEPLFRDTLLPAVLHGGAAVYRFTRCSAEVAWKRQPTRSYQLPSAILCIVPPLLLEAPAAAPTLVAEEDEADEADERDHRV